MKGIILASDRDNVCYLVALCVSAHFIPVDNGPAVDHRPSVPILARMTEILIITPLGRSSFAPGDDSQYRIRLTSAEQHDPRALAGAFGKVHRSW